MQSHDQIGATQALQELLDNERAALIAGDFETLADLLTSKEALMETLGKVPLDNLPELQALDEKARQNQLLFDSALEGIRTVAARLAKLREVKAAFETYGADGKKHDIKPEPETSVERRA
ncbi:MAG: flagellar biosynthesis protein FlgN [Pseudomonadota bacterium]